MSTTKRLILHIGGPKCGSSALQAALSTTPSFRSKAGTEFAYTGLRPRKNFKNWTVLKGRGLATAAGHSVYGYMSCPDLGPTEDPQPVFAALDRVWKGTSRGPVPVLSNEGWVGQSETFQNYLPHWFETGRKARQIDVLAYARPPLDWLNSAYWQWGVWSGRSFQGWLETLAMPYRLGLNFSRWQAMPNVQLRLHMSGDVLEHFNSDMETSLKPSTARNTALPPAMVGFLMRNRRFRPTAHDSATEFVFQRWCDIPDAPKLWALLPRHVQMVRQAIRDDVDTLFSLLPEDEACSVRREDPRWVSNEPYHDLIRGGRSKLDVPEEQAQLYLELCRGVRKAAEAVDKSTPRLEPPLGTNAGVHAWDVLIATALEHLVVFDTKYRRGKSWSAFGRSRKAV